MNNINKNIITQLELLKEERLSIEKEAKMTGKTFRNKVINLFIEATSN